MVSKASSLNFYFRFLNRISLLLNELVTLLSSRGWLDPVQNLETVLGYVLTAIPKRSFSLFNFLYLALLTFHCSFSYSRIIFAVHYSWTNCTNHARDYNKSWQHRQPLCHLPPIEQLFTKDKVAPQPIGHLNTTGKTILKFCHKTNAIF